MIIKIAFALILSFGFLYLYSKTGIIFSFENENQKYQYLCKGRLKSGFEFFLIVYSDKDTATIQDILHFLQKRITWIITENNKPEKIFINKPKIDSLTITCKENEYDNSRV